jgi:pimeloyl-ACP methyl ester carboxylesterase
MITTRDLNKPPLKTIETDALEIAYLEYGPDNGWPVILSHGFPYDVNAYNEVAPILADAGARVFTPYTRGFGPTRFRSNDVIRSGQQTARAIDIIQFSAVLGLQLPILGGFDWGGNASCVATALWPEQVGGLVSYAGYDVMDIDRQRHSFHPSLERICWYQHLFQSERGRECLTSYRYDLCRILWHEWSPTWQFDDATFERSATSFDNPDFVDVVIDTYRCMLGVKVGDPAMQALENILAQKPRIRLPAVTLDGTKDPLKPGGTADHASLFIAQYEHRVFETGHNLPQEEPQAFADAVMQVHKWLH